ncbi:O-antigen ligase family protein [Curtobacterium flaccumfaciens]|uniref:O-antigen ligase family protein n=1 Tax=Curtobacterium flaccumfaciens TaxID=2035 RepID=UPI001BE0BC9B|nr:O-antigen ligase family protein [Curtobacterium flaccumfaciens]MBT1585052.1 exopolysaccharide production protein [Curtobacterium flaccumfaciens pv. flaccumfaciens]MCX2799052.1 O-antigen ligase family protein [Curtobacterium flaccumfaciens pv. flaccumfaciens]
MTDGRLTKRVRARRYLSAWIGFSAGGRFSQALATVIVLFAFGQPTVGAVVGTAGTWAVLVTLFVLAGLSLLGQRYRIEWHGVLPLSLLAFVGYCALSVLWSEYSWVALRGLVATVCFMGLGLYLALGRDLVQVIRASGDAFRILLVTALGLEVLSGLVLDVPFPAFGIRGDIAYGGPIQGIGGTRNFMGFIAAMALVTFVVEFLTRSVTLWRAVASTALAVIALMLVQSPITGLAMIALAVTALALWSLRHARPSTRPVVNGVLGATVLLALVVAVLARGRLLAEMGAAGGTATRLDLWSQIRVLTERYPIQGWGWVGTWPREAVVPYVTLIDPAGMRFHSGLNAFVDAWLQIGLAGTIILAVTALLAFARAWVTATTFPGVAYVWPAAVLVLLAVTSAAESYLLHGAGLMVFVTVLVIAARRRSWRRHLPRP